MFTKTCRSNWQHVAMSSADTSTSHGSGAHDHEWQRRRPKLFPEGSATLKMSIMTRSAAATSLINAKSIPVPE